MPGAEAGTHLRDALAHEDPVVRGYAALALGARGAAEALPTLVDMVVEGRNDTDAADALSVLAGDPTTADRLVHDIVERLTDATTAAPARGRLTQALADIPGTGASAALVELSRDADRAVALTAAYLLQLREDPTR
jgi:HEAT repeat protein